MKYIKLFENKNFNIGDFVRIIVDELEVGNFEITKFEKDAIFIIYEYDFGWNDIDGPVLIEPYYYYGGDLKLSVYNKEIEKISKEDVEVYIQANKYNL